MSVTIKISLENFSHFIVCHSSYVTVDCEYILKMVELCPLVTLKCIEDNYTKDVHRRIMTT